MVFLISFTNDQIYIEEMLYLVYYFLIYLLIQMIKILVNMLLLYVMDFLIVLSNL